jgi:hypothetical protein
MGVIAHRPKMAESTRYSKHAVGGEKKKKRGWRTMRASSAEPPGTD